MDLLDNPEYKDYVVILEHKVILVVLDQLDLQDLEEILDQQVLLDHEDPMEHQVTLVQPDNLVQGVNAGLQVKLEHLDHQVLKVQKVLSDNKDLKGYKAHLDYPEMQDQLDRVVTWVQLVLWDLLEHLVLSVEQEQPVQLVCPELEVQ